MGNNMDNNKRNKHKDQTYDLLLNHLKPGHLIVSHSDSLKSNVYFLICSRPFIRPYNVSYRRNYICKCLSFSRGCAVEDCSRPIVELVPVKVFVGICHFGFWYDRNGDLNQTPF